MDIKLSIIIPMYNIEKYIKDCLDSIEFQYASKYEVIIIDDGSTDTCPQFVDEYIENKRNYISIHQENGGLSDARNRGIMESKGEYLLFLDGDDLLIKNSLSIFIDFLCASDSDIVICHYDQFDDLYGLYTTGPDLSKYNCDDPFMFYDKFVNRDNNWISAWCCVVRRDFIIDNKLMFYKDILHEDELWVPMIIKYAKKICLYNSPVYLYRTNRRGSIMASVTYKHLHDKLLICRELNKLKDDNSRHFIGKRICTDMFSVVLSTPLLFDRADIKKITEEYNCTLFCLKNREGFGLYLISKIIGFTNLVRIAALRKRG